MYRFLLLYGGVLGHHQCYAEGLIHVDGAVYVRGFYKEEGRLFADMHALRCSMRDNEDISFFSIQMIDQPAKE